MIFNLFGAQELVDKLMATLEQFPPQQPSRPAVDLLVAIGEQQQYLLYTNLLPPPGSPGALDALQVFGVHVERWIDSSQEALCSRCRQIEATTIATAVISDRGNAEEGKTCCMFRQYWLRIDHGCAMFVNLQLSECRVSWP